MWGGVVTGNATGNRSTTEPISLGVSLAEWTDYIFVIIATNRGTDRYCSFTYKKGDTKTSWSHVGGTAYTGDHWILDFENGTALNYSFGSTYGQYYWMFIKL